MFFLLFFLWIHYRRVCSAEEVLVTTGGVLIALTSSAYVSPD
jgi:hypothetical protein